MHRCESEPAHGKAGGWGSDFFFFFCFSLSLSLSALSFHPSIYLSFHLSIHLSIYVVIYLSIYAYVSQHLFMYLFIYHTWKFEHGRDNDMCFTLLTWDQVKAANIEITCTWPSLYLWSFIYLRNQSFANHKQHFIPQLEPIKCLNFHFLNTSVGTSFRSSKHLYISIDVNQSLFTWECQASRLQLAKTNAMLLRRIVLYIYMYIRFTCFFLVVEPRCFWYILLERKSNI